MDNQRDFTIGSEVSDRILETAESLFARKGFGVSLREITAAADVNVAAVNYYFGSKTKLTEAVFDRLSSRVNSERLAALEALIAAAKNGGTKLDVRDIIKIFVKPYLFPAEKGQLLARLILQHRIERSALTSTIIQRHFDPMASKFIEALSFATQAPKPESFYWRYVFMVGAIVLTVTDVGPGSRLERLSDGNIQAGVEAMEKEVVDFLVGGMMADTAT
ncbi:TetR/AcrR family transcriptional regulator [Rhizobium leguminosarum]|uniref:TetR/AcrR family transcriptional regulator n=1 Tax=Rhizobium leguminosarum TaxID=384 RepID=UPI00143F5887|nr:TetR/AcrR family transcriptional regulator [Rhizobium leguminosarum]NKL23922.1 TetR family transcriptional regulator [Rhizobium leguminosarum bv. viciae]